MRIGQSPCFRSVTALHNDFYAKLKISRKCQLLIEMMRRELSGHMFSLEQVRTTISKDRSNLFVSFIEFVIKCWWWWTSAPVLRELFPCRTSFGHWCSVMQLPVRRRSGCKAEWSHAEGPRNPWNQYTNKELDCWVDSCTEDWVFFLSFFLVY